MMADPNKRPLPKIPMVLTAKMIDDFALYLKGERLDFSRDIASRIMAVAVGFFTMPVIEWEKTAQAMIDEAYDRGHADGRCSSEIHIHVPEGSSLAKAGDSLVVRPGDMADWKQAGTGI